MSIASWQGSTIGSGISVLAGQTLGTGIGAWAGLELGSMFCGYCFDIHNSNGTVSLDDASLLNMHIDSEESGSIFAKTNNTFDGDFSASIDLKAIMLLAVGSTEMTFMLYIDSENNVTAYVYRGSSRRRIYFRGRLDGVITDQYINLDTTYTDLSFRLARSGSIVSMSYKRYSEDSWNDFGNTYTWRSDDINIVLGLKNYSPYPEAEAEFSNLEIT